MARIMHPPQGMEPIGQFLDTQGYRWALCTFERDGGFSLLNARFVIWMPI
jgi:hypothetical protein